MEVYERECFISRIALGYIKYIDEYVSLYIYHPDIDVSYESQEVYKQSYQRAYDKGVSTEDEIVYFLMEHQLWDDEKETILKKLPTDLEDLKVQLFEAAYNDTAKFQIRNQIRGLKKTIGDMSSIRHSYDHITCQGLATYSKWNYVIENSTKTKDGYLYNWKYVTLPHMVGHYQSSLLSDTQLREIAKSEPWRTTWLACRKGGGNVFHKPGCSLTSEQKGLILWSNMYDNIAESQECPDEDVVEDDDMLDGWLILQRRERESTKIKKSVDSKLSNDKISNAGEIYLVAPTIEDAEKIDKMNDPLAKATKSQRDRLIKKLGNVRQSQFSDVKQDLRAQANQSFIQNVKGK